MVENIAISFMNELFFKVVLGSQDNQSNKLHRMILTYLTKVDFVEIKIINPNIIPEELNGKEIVLDILATNELGNKYNIEMQTSNYSKMLNYRFQFYRSRLLTASLEKSW